MTPQEIEQAGRAFDKAKMASPQALADWAKEYAPRLMSFATLCATEKHSVDQLAPLRPLYPNVGGDLADHAAQDIAALRQFRTNAIDAGRIESTALTQAEREKLTRDYPGHIAALCENDEKLATFVIGATGAIDALRPFAAFGAPPVLEAIEQIRAMNDAPEDTPPFAVLDPNGPGTLCSVTREQLVTAHDLINEIDGGEGA